MHTSEPFVDSRPEGTPLKNMDFANMSRRRLQQLCKKVGIKANVPNKEMIDGLTSYYGGSRDGCAPVLSIEHSDSKQTGTEDCVTDNFSSQAGADSIAAPSNSAASNGVKAGGGRQPEVTSRRRRNVESSPVTTPVRRSRRLHRDADSDAEQTPLLGSFTAVVHMGESGGLVSSGKKTGKDATGRARRRVPLNLEALNGAGGGSCNETKTNLNSKFDGCGLGQLHDIQEIDGEECQGMVDESEANVTARAKGKGSAVRSSAAAGPGRRAAEGSRRAVDVPHDATAKGKVESERNAPSRAEGGRALDSSAVDQLEGSRVQPANRAEATSLGCVTDSRNADRRQGKRVTVDLTMEESCRADADEPSAGNNVCPVEDLRVPPMAADAQVAVEADVAKTCVDVSQNKTADVVELEEVTALEEQREDVQKDNPTAGSDGSNEGKVVVVKEDAACDAEVCPNESAKESGKSDVEEMMVDAHEVGLVQKVENEESLKASHLSGRRQTYKQLAIGQNRKKDAAGVGSARRLELLRGKRKQINADSVDLELCTTSQETGDAQKPTDNADDVQKVDIEMADGERKCGDGITVECKAGSDSEIEKVDGRSDLAAQIDGTDMDEQMPSPVEQTEGDLLSKQGVKEEERAGLPTGEDEMVVEDLVGEVMPSDLDAAKASPDDAAAKSSIPAMEPEGPTSNTAVGSAAVVDSLADTGRNATAEILCSVETRFISGSHPAEGNTADPESQLRETRSCPSVGRNEGQESSPVKADISTVANIREMSECADSTREEGDAEGKSETRIEACEEEGNAGPLFQSGCEATHAVKTQEGLCANADASEGGDVELESQQRRMSSEENVSSLVQVTESNTAVHGQNTWEEECANGSGGVGADVKVEDSKNCVEVEHRDCPLRIQATLDDAAAMEASPAIDGNRSICPNLGRPEEALETVGPPDVEARRDTDNTVLATTILTEGERAKAGLPIDDNRSSCPNLGRPEEALETVGPPDAEARRDTDNTVLETTILTEGEREKASLAIDNNRGICANLGRPEDTLETVRPPEAEARRGTDNAVLATTILTEGEREKASLAIDDNGGICANLGRPEDTLDTVRPPKAEVRRDADNAVLATTILTEGERQKASLAIDDSMEICANLGRPGDALDTVRPPEAEVRRDTANAVLAATILTEGECDELPSAQCRPMDIQEYVNAPSSKERGWCNDGSAREVERIVKECSEDAVREGQDTVLAADIHSEDEGKILPSATTILTEGEREKATLPIDDSRGICANLGRPEDALDGVRPPEAEVRRDTDNAVLATTILTEGECDELPSAQCRPMDIQDYVNAPSSDDRGWCNDGSAREVERIVKECSEDAVREGQDTVLAADIHSEDEGKIVPSVQSRMVEAGSCDGASDLKDRACTEGGAREMEETIPSAREKEEEIPSSKVAGLDAKDSELSMASRTEGGHVSAPPAQCRMPESMDEDSQQRSKESECDGRGRQETEGNKSELRLPETEESERPCLESVLRGDGAEGNVLQAEELAFIHAIEEGADFPTREALESKGINLSCGSDEQERGLDGQGYGDPRQDEVDKRILETIKEMEDDAVRKIEGEKVGTAEKAVERGQSLDTTHCRMERDDKTEAVAKGFVEVLLEDAKRQAVQINSPKAQEILNKHRENFKRFPFMTREAIRKRVQDSRSEKRWAILAEKRAQGQACEGIALKGDQMTDSSKVVDCASNASAHREPCSGPSGSLCGRQENTSSSQKADGMENVTDQLDTCGAAAVDGAHVVEAKQVDTVPSVDCSSNRVTDAHSRVEHGVVAKQHEPEKKHRLERPFGSSKRKAEGLVETLLREDQERRTHVRSLKLLRRKRGYLFKRWSVPAGQSLLERAQAWSAAHRFLLLHRMRNRSISVL
ncbi:hypothetical protein CBR_g8923 [Chara braunii]|uniref:Uncharacterized protein n=1 Tax=Chara braunii TaxID=69332 RepID=A0A388KN67_CHABU|nr:hypothetical protein CBR_g8923 [Chara braunii]|eukprot:GBG71506.1 hypothetical protein CBR_g8923 [Chara braunii]